MIQMESVFVVVDHVCESSSEVRVDEGAILQFELEARI